MKKSFDNCILYLPFDNSLDDISGSANNGVPNGAPLSYENSGISGPSLILNGTDQYISSSITPTINTENWTVSVWLKPIQIAGDSLVFMCGDTNSGYGIALSSSEGYGLASYGIERFGDFNTVFCAYGGVGWFNTGIYIPRINAWNHLALRRNNITTELFINGSKTNWTLEESPLAPANGYLIGGSSDLQVQYGNSLDEIQMYDRDLTDLEIKELYQIAVGLKFVKHNVKVAISHKFIKDEVNPVLCKEKVFSSNSKVKPRLAKGLKYKDIIDHRVEINSKKPFLDAYNLDKKSLTKLPYKNYILTQGFSLGWRPRANEYFSKYDSFSIAEFIGTESSNKNTFNFLDYTCLNTTSFEKNNNERVWTALIHKHLSTEKIEFSIKESIGFFDKINFSEDTYSSKYEKSNISFIEKKEIINSFNPNFIDKLIDTKVSFIKKEYVVTNYSGPSTFLREYFEPTCYIKTFSEIKNRIESADFLNSRRFNKAINTEFSDAKLNKGGFEKEYSEKASGKEIFIKKFTILEHLSNIFFKEYFETVQSIFKSTPNDFRDYVFKKTSFTRSFIEIMIKKDKSQKSFTENPLSKEMLKIHQYIETPIFKNLMASNFTSMISLRDKINPIFNEVPHVRDKLMTTFNEVPHVRDKIVTSFNEIPNLKHLLKTGFANLESSNIKLLNIKYNETLQLKKVLEKRFTELILTNKHILKNRLYSYNLNNKELARRPLGSFIKMKKDIHHGYVSQSFVKFVKQNMHLEKTALPDLTMRMLVICTPWRK